jgi:phosphatidate cytidylyltransferase
VLERFDPALRKRLVSALVMAAIALAGVIEGGWPFAVLVGLASAAMAFEWARLVRAISRDRDAVSGALDPLALGLALAAPLLGVALAAQGWPLPALAVPLALGAVGLVLARLVRAGPVWLVAWGPVYLGLPAVALIWLRAVDEGGMSLVVWLFVVIWTTDTAAYFVGRTLRGPKLAPAISPGKTWSGAIGGTIAAAIASLLVVRITGGVAWAAPVAVVVSAVGQAGDLFESWIKRLAGAKDSGTLIPGHGGALDRLDAMLWAAPMLALIVAVLGEDLLT